jgi:hypothetical protein
MLVTPARRRLVVAALVAALAWALPAGASPSVATVELGAAAGPAAAVPPPCGTRSTGPAHYQSVVWIVLENRSASAAMSPATMPTLTSLARACATATAMHAVSHPSLPNYLALVSGSTGGVRSDCSPTVCPQRRTTLFDQVTAVRKSWAVYAESMGTPCQRTSKGRYAARHNPAVYFPRLRASCLRHDVALGTPTRGSLSAALKRGTVPSFTLVVPNLCSDGHDCSNATVNRWLRGWVSHIVGSPQYRAGRLALVITYDEGAGGRNGQVCVTSSDPSCHIATVVAAASVRPGTRVTTSLSGYSLLRLTEDLLGLRGTLGAARRLSSPRRAFGL